MNSKINLFKNKKNELKKNLKPLGNIIYYNESKHGYLVNDAKELSSTYKEIMNFNDLYKDYSTEKIIQYGGFDVGKLNRAIDFVKN